MFFLVYPEVSIGSPITTCIRPGLNDIELLLGITLQLPLMVTGRIGSPLLTAIRNPPLLNSLTTPSSDLVPSANTATLTPLGRLLKAASISRREVRGLDRSMKTCFARYKAQPNMGTFLNVFFMTHLNGKPTLSIMAGIS